MAKIYLKKIKNKEMNIATGEAWKLQDVPLCGGHKVRGARMLKILTSDKALPLSIPSS